MVHERRIWIGRTSILVRDESLRRILFDGIDAIVYVHDMFSLLDRESPSLPPETPSQ